LLFIFFEILGLLESILNGNWTEERNKIEELSVLLRNRVPL